MKDYVLLHDAQLIFAFRNLRQTIYFTDKYREDIRQRRRGQRRYVHVADLARAILSERPRRGVTSDLEMQVLKLANEQETLTKQRDTARAAFGELMAKVQAAGGEDGMKTSEKLRQENDYLRRMTELIDDFVRLCGVERPWRDLVRRIPPAPSMHG